MRPTRLSIGDFNQRVTFNTQTIGADDVNGDATVVTGADVVRWANVVFKSGASNGASVNEGGLEYTEQFEINVRAPLIVSEGDLATYAGMQLRVTSVDVVSKGKIKVIAKGKV